MYNIDDFTFNKIKNLCMLITENTQKSLPLKSKIELEASFILRNIRSLQRTRIYK